jgi:hypothetical protein
MGRVTAVAPAGLVPAAWVVTFAAHAGVVSARTVFVALVVMSVLLAAFFLASLGEMTGLLCVWQYVIVAGLAATLAGVADMALLSGTTVLPVTLYAWMLLPGLAYFPTGTAHTDGRLRNVYLGAATLSLFGAGLYALGHVAGVEPAATLVAGLATVGAGQTAGIVTAVRQNAGGRGGDGR